jgi:hypothetical protein
MKETKEYIETIFFFFIYSLIENLCSLNANGNHMLMSRSVLSAEND